MRVPGIAPSETATLWLRELYPLDIHGQLGALRPDRLAELHVTRELAASPALAHACLNSLDAPQARRALVLLARASADHQAGRAPLESALLRFPAEIAEMDAPRQVMTAIADAIPYPSLALAEAHASISERIVTTYGSGTAGRALWLNNYANLLGDLGRREEALAAIEEAVTIRRDLPQARPDAFRPDLAASLNNQANQLAGLGRREEALAAIEEAVTICRDLAQRRPAAYVSRLAGSLESQAVILSSLGHIAEAQAAREEAAAIRDY